MSRKKVERNIAYDDVRNRYYITLEFGRDPETGKQVRKTQTFEKLKQARAALRKHEAARDAGKVVIPRALTVAQWLDEWMKTTAVINRAVTTVYGYQKMIDNHIVPAIGDIPLQELKPQHLQRYYAMLIQEKGLSSNTAHKHHDLLNLTLKRAVIQGLLNVNPAERVEVPKKIIPEIHFYTQAELEKLFQLVTGTRLEVMVLLAGYLGLRREEILGLTWDCVSFSQRTLAIKTVRTAAGSTVVTKGPKTPSSRRMLYIPDDLDYALRRELGKQWYYRERLLDAYYEGNYIVTHEDGRPYRPNYASDLFVKFIREHDLPPLTLHGLRHSFASIANAKGIPMYDIGKALGHSTPATTSKIYTHLMDSNHQDMLKRLWGGE